MGLLCGLLLLLGALAVRREAVAAVPLAPSPPAVAAYASYGQPAAPEAPPVPEVLLDAAKEEEAFERREEAPARAADIAIAVAVDVDIDIDAAAAADVADAAPVEEALWSPCDAAARQALARRAATAYKGVYYANDFRYLLDPCYDDWHLGERLKQLDAPLGGTLDVGGEYRLRAHHERNFRGTGLSGNDDDFLLQRVRLYGDARWRLARVYAEMIHAQSDFETFPPRPIEENRADMLNLFGEALLLDGDRLEVSGRAGRQEILYGDQRLLSPLDWGNTRRTFDGFKLLSRSGDWTLDGFWLRPVIVDPRRFDAPDENQELYGVYASYGGCPGTALDLYWLGYANYNLQVPAIPANDLITQTVGGRHAATYGAWQTLAEGAYQFGRLGPYDHSAGFFTLGLGRTWDASYTPQLWVYYDWASGDEVRGNGFNQLFPLGHRYLGYMDLFGRSNIQDINVMATADLTAKVKLQLWWHCFFLQNTNDVPYNVAGRPIVANPGGSRYLGQELDLLLTWTLTPRADLLLGYSHFFSGDWYRTNPDAAGGYTGDADFFYTQLSVRF